MVSRARASALVITDPLHPGAASSCYLAITLLPEVNVAQSSFRFNECQRAAKQLAVALRRGGPALSHHPDSPLRSYPPCPRTAWPSPPQAPTPPSDPSVLQRAPTATSAVRLDLDFKTAPTQEAVPGGAISPIQEVPVDSTVPTPSTVSRIQAAQEISLVRLTFPPPETTAIRIKRRTQGQHER